jgi:hypothetical protein
MAKRGRPPKHTSLPLAQAISETIQKYCDPITGALPAAAAEHGLALLMPDVIRDLARQQFWARLKDSMKHRVKALIDSGTKPLDDLPFPGLFEAYTLTLDGERSIKRTRKLTRLEFKQAILVRKKQHEKDGEAIAALEQAEAAVSQIWDEHPALLFEDVCLIYVRQRRAA